MKIAKIFRNGRSLAVRLPKKWIEGVSEVGLEKRGDEIILCPRRKCLGDLAESFRKDPVVIKRFPQTQTPAKVFSETTR